MTIKLIVTDYHTIPDYPDLVALELQGEDCDLFNIIVDRRLAWVILDWIDNPEDPEYPPEVLEVEEWVVIPWPLEGLVI